VQSAYSQSNGYLGQMAQYAANYPDSMDWNRASTDIRGVSSKLREIFALHLGKVLVQVF